MNYFLLICLMTLSACASPGYYEDTKPDPNYIGKNADELVKEFGSPTSVTPLSTGGQVVVFHLSSGTITLRSSYYARTKEKYCERIFTINPSNTITAYTHKGNACKEPNL